MPRTCTICNHPEREAIETAIVAGISNRSIALQFGTSHMAVQRHATDHIQQEIKNSQAAQEEARGLDIVKQLKEINDITREILKQSRGISTHEITLKAVARVEKQLELQAKLLGAIDDRPVNIYITPEWIAIRTVIVQALKPYPDARRAVAAALAQMETNRDRFN